MLACDALTAGKFDCSLGNFHPDEASCILQCIEGAPCDQLREFACAGEIFQTIPDNDLGRCTTACYSPMFQCGGGQELFASEVCDGWEACENGADEADCPPPATVACDDGQRIPARDVCNQIADCKDRSDELGCPPVMFRCANGSSIPAELECDGEDECGDGSDEVGCAQFVCGS